MKLADVLMGPLVAAFGLTVIWGAVALPQVPGLRFGPDLMPILIGGGLVLSGVSILVSTLVTANKSVTAAHPVEQPLFDLSDWNVSLRRKLAAVWTLLGPVFGIALFDVAGFPLVALVYMAVLMALMGARALTVALVAPVTVLVFYLGFSEILRVPLPAGWLGVVLP